MRATSPFVTRFVDGILSNFVRPAAAIAQVDCQLRKPTRSEMAGYMFGKAPTVLKGLLRHFPAGEWSLELLKALDLKCAKKPTICVARTSVEQGETRIEEIPLSEYLAYVEITSNVPDEDIPQQPDLEVPQLLDMARYMYCNEEPTLIHDHFPELLAQLQTIRDIYPWYIAQDYSFWIGPKGSVTGLHSDLDYNSLMQCQGRKLMIFIDRQEEHLLYRSAKFDPGATLSLVDLRRPSYNAQHFPLIRTATPYLTVLEPGDLICIPRKWYHFVACTEGPSVSCTVHCNTLATKAAEDVSKAAHWLGLHGRGAAGCTCHNSGSNSSSARD